MTDDKPPHLTVAWIEDKSLRHKEYLGNVLFLDSRLYVNTKSRFYLEGMVACEILNSGTLLISRNVKLDSEDAMCIIFYLLLEDGTWAKGKPNVNYKCDLDFDRQDKGIIFTLVISLETENGIKERKIIKKYEKFRD